MYAVSYSVYQIEGPPVVLEKTVFILLDNQGNSLIPLTTALQSAKKFINKYEKNVNNDIWIHGVKHLVGHIIEDKGK